MPDLGNEIAYFRHRASGLYDFFVIDKVTGERTAEHTSLGLDESELQQYITDYIDGRR